MPAAVSLAGIAAVAAATLAVGCATTGSARTKTATPAHELETFRFVVYGMTCDACAKHAVREMQKLSGVVTANVDFDSKQATVQAKRATTTFPDIGQVHGNFIEQIESIIRANAHPKRLGRP